MLKPRAYITSQGVFGGLINGRRGLYVAERRDKTYPRNKLKLTYHYISSYIYNTFIVCHNKRRIYFKNVYKTDLRDCLKRNAKGTHQGFINVFFFLFLDVRNNRVICSIRIVFKIQRFSLEVISKHQVDKNCCRIPDRSDLTVFQSDPRETA